MLGYSLVSDKAAERYEKNCEEYDQIINMFKELGSGQLSRTDVLKNITTMVHGGLLDKLDELVSKIELYEETGGLYCGRFFD